MDFIATFNSTNGINYGNLQEQLNATLNVTTDGTFLAGSDLQLGNVITFEGRHVEQMQTGGLYDFWATYGTRALLPEK